MPQQIICKGCGAVLYRGIELRSPSEVIAQFGGHCPNCGKKLEFSISSVEIKAVQQ